MPLYAYRCESCGEDFDAFRTPAARHTASCPSCGKRGRKLLHPVGLIFKGSGFHVTDYPNSDRKKAKEEDKPAPVAKSETK